MNNKEIKKKFDGELSELRKIINSWKLIKGSPNDEFDNLNHKILSQLYKNSDCDKIDRILQSELVVCYGLYKNEFDSEELVKEIMFWWNSKLY
ncbi:hypothetical protein [Flavobacterium sp.]|uniref:hypothetical protein n=1 Tax=Flavobacterium sp. TaxID=239 RepID=UPI00263150C4|nr:hypothetical protein [Flavobacterium sp.]